MLDLIKNLKNKKVVDLSVTVTDQSLSDPPMQRPSIKYRDHKETEHGFAKMIGLESGEGFKETLGWADEQCQVSTHCGTHVDAPWHFYPTTDGEPAMRIDDIPLDWFFGQAIMFDFSDKPFGTILTSDDFKEYLEKFDYELQEGDIVLINTGANKHFDTEEYLDSGSGVGREGTLWLIDQGVKVTGTDAWGWDIPFKFQAENYAKDQDDSKIWEGHRAGKEKPYCHIEKLTNLDKLPFKGSLMMCFPYKIKGASAGWTRAVAFVDKE